MGRPSKVLLVSLQPAGFRFSRRDWKGAYGQKRADIHPSHIHVTKCPSQTTPMRSVVSASCRKPITKKMGYGKRFTPERDILSAAYAPLERRRASKHELARTAARLRPTGG